MSPFQSFLFGYFFNNSLKFDLTSVLGVSIQTESINLLVAAIVVIAGYMALSFLAIHALHSQQGQTLINDFCIDNNMTLSISVCIYGRSAMINIFSGFPLIDVVP